MVYELRHQPFRGLYLTVQTVYTLFVRLPTWLIVYLPKSNRPRPTWPYLSTILLEVVKWTSFLGPLAARAGPLIAEPDHRAIKRGRGIKGVWIPPCPDLVVGEVKQWAEQANVEAIQIPGYWYNKKGTDIAADEPASPGEKVIYHIHGGGFIGGTAVQHPPDIYNTFGSRLAQTHPSVKRVFLVEYRMTTGPPLQHANPFPAALIDALAGYTYLINTLHFAPEDIILSGDSAGGNLALALTRYIIETSADPSLAHVPIPKLPRALVLLSPWCDLGESHEGATKSLTTHTATDYIQPCKNPLFLYARKNYCGCLGFPVAANTNRYISPASVHPHIDAVSFKGFPKTFLTYGGAETLYDQCVSLEKKMQEDLGKDGLTVYVVDDAVHDIMLAWFWDPLYSDSFNRLGQYLDSVFSL
ncbi:Alpha/Beta hydrolase protein [Cristinia sonorae]|uniref:Alpha/Beta hydrolase protein n=1 Tax=Cristinia sonorae TaxID=1940300 RepID=A0A8K0XNN8_9AGAR|nr:Alpha/Beta hydrolase protein [Cristinia sonorae]